MTENKWTWFDINLCVLFLWTQVKSPVSHNYTKTGRFIGCFKNTVHITFVSGTDSNDILTSCIPVSFTVHPEFSSHTSTSIPLVRGSVLSLSSKQKSNGESSSKARLI